MAKPKKLTFAQALSQPTTTVRSPTPEMARPIQLGRLLHMRIDVAELVGLRVVAADVDAEVSEVENSVLASSHFRKPYQKDDDACDDHYDTG